MELNELLDKVIEVAKGAGELIRSKANPDVFVKEGRGNFVTSMDIASQNYCIARLGEILPGSHFFAEEKEDNRLEPGYNWIIDPIDGTMNFMLGYNHSCISIGLVKDGIGVLGVVYDPFLDELFSGIRGQGATLNGRPIHIGSCKTENAIVMFGTACYYRELTDITFDTVKEVYKFCADVRRSGSAALDICYAACGKVDAFYEVRLQPWDYTASVIIAREAGANPRALQNDEISFCRPVGIVVGEPEICDRIDAIVNDYAKTHS